MTHFDQSIAALQERLREHEAKVLETKRLINALSQEAGRGPVYADADMRPETSLGSIQPDTFYGQPLNTSIRRVLEMRKASNLGPATVREIYDTLVSGGFEFPRAKSEKNAMDSLRISLGKSSHTFHKLPNGSYGLIEWYPAVKQSRGRRPAAADERNGEDEELNGGEQESE